VKKNLKLSTDKGHVWYHAHGMWDTWKCIRCRLEVDTHPCAGHSNTLKSGEEPDCPGYTVPSVGTHKS
jgi:hypothetical protein